MKLKKINWEYNKKEGNIEYYYGKIDDILLFSICRFKEENYVMNSHVIPMSMKKDIDLQKIKVIAKKELDMFINNIVADG